MKEKEINGYWLGDLVFVLFLYPPFHTGPTVWMMYLAGKSYHLLFLYALFHTHLANGIQSEASLQQLYELHHQHYFA